MKSEPTNWHVDYAADSALSESEEETVCESIRSIETVELCCSRFSEAVNAKEIIFAYSESNEIDETSWFIPGFWHLYFCPFCGKKIKGLGFGKYDQLPNKAFLSG